MQRRGATYRNEEFGPCSTRYGSPPEYAQVVPVISGGFDVNGRKIIIDRSRRAYHVTLKEHKHKNCWRTIFQVIHQGKLADLD
jgi:hypothetical protein